MVCLLSNQITLTWKKWYLIICAIIYVISSDTGFNTEEEETSGYESEGGQSLSPSALNDITPLAVSPSSGRRPRTAFTAEQINSLEKAFKRNAYLGTQDKAELCKRLNLSDKQVNLSLNKTNFFDFQKRFYSFIQNKNA